MASLSRFLDLENFLFENFFHWNDPALLERSVFFDPVTYRSSIRTPLLPSTSRRLLICWRKAFESSEVRGRQDVSDIGGCWRQDEGWVPVTSLSRQRRRDTTRSCGCGGSGGDGGRRGRRGGWRSAPVVGPRCQLVSTPWYPDIGSNKPRGTNISYDRSGILSLVPPSSDLFLVCLVPPFDPARAIKRNQDATDNHEKLFTGCFGTVRPYDKFYRLVDCIRNFKTFRGILSKADCWVLIEAINLF